MFTIWKYQLQVTDLQLVKMPSWSTILTVRSLDDDRIFMWAEVDKDKPEVERRIIMAGTGQAYHRNKDIKYIGTVLTMGGTFVWHVFDGGEL